MQKRPCLTSEVGSLRVLEPVCALLEGHGHLLLPERASQHGAMSLTERRLVDVEFVGVDRSLHDVLAQAVGAGDQDDVAKAGFRIEREDHAARADVGADHLHHADRQPDLEVIESVVDAIDDAAVGEQRGEALTAGLEQVVGAGDVEVGLVLAGEARGRQILGGRGAAHGDGDIGSVLLFERLVGGCDALAHRLRAGGGVDDPAGLGGVLREQREVGDVEVVQQRAQRRPGVGRLQGFVIGLRGQREAVGNADALRTEFVIHLAERGVLSADQRDVVIADALEPAKISRIVHHGCVPRLPSRDQNPCAPGSR